MQFASITITPTSEERDRLSARSQHADQRAAQQCPHGRTTEEIPDTAPWMPAGATRSSDPIPCQKCAR